MTVYSVMVAYKSQNGWVLDKIFNTKEDAESYTLQLEDDDTIRGYSIEETEVE